MENARRVCVYRSLHNHPTVRGHSTHTHTHRLITKWLQVTDEQRTADEREQARAISIHVHDRTTGNNDHVTPGKRDGAETDTGGSVSIPESLAYNTPTRQAFKQLRGLAENRGGSKEECVCVCVRDVLKKLSI